MPNAQCILVVDDTADNRTLLKMLLEDKYQVVEASSGAECLEKIEANKPDLVLLDVNMPGMTGYEVCIQLRKDKQTEALPVIFVSALDSSEERLAGFEAGADDYITKPVDGLELLEKVAFRLTRSLEIVEAKQEASTAMNVAMEAMTSSSELGEIIQFVKKVQLIDTLEGVGQSIIDIARNFGLNSCALITGNNPIFVGCEEESIEAKVLDKFQQSPERVTNLGIRTIIRSDNLVLLVKNMPLDEESRYGRLKDHLVVLEDIAYGRLTTLHAQNAIGEQRIDIINKLISLAEDQIKLTSEKIHGHSETITNTMSDMLNELENMLFGLGLDDDQEKKLIQLADKTSIKLNESSESTSHLDSDLGVILEALYTLLEKEK